MDGIGKSGFTVDVPTSTSTVVCTLIPGVVASAPSAYPTPSPDVALHGIEWVSTIDDSPSERFAVPAGLPPSDSVRTVAIPCGVTVTSAATRTRT